MTTYQDVVDYMNKNGGKFTVVKHNAHYTIKDNNDDYYTISIYKDCYSTTMIIDKGLSKLLADLLDTPVDKRFKPIKHTDPE